MGLVLLILPLFIHAKEVASPYSNKSPTVAAVLPNPTEVGECSPLKIAKKEKDEYVYLNKDGKEISFKEKMLELNPEKNGDSVFQDLINSSDPKNINEEIYVKIKAESAGLGDAEILARLIYSEALSTGYWKNKCSAPSADDLMKSIGWSLMNRVEKIKKKPGNPYWSVVFQPQQFATSFSSNVKQGRKSFATYFMCPLKGNYINCNSQNVCRDQTAKKIYESAVSIADKIITEYTNKTGIPAEYRGITNFFYPQSEFFGEMRPLWAKNIDPSKNKGYINILKVTDKPCVEFYRIK